MWTIAWCGGWIHGNTWRDACRVQFPDYSEREVQSLHAAKCPLPRAARLGQHQRA